MNRSAWFVACIFILGVAACGSVSGDGGPDAGFSCPTGETACPAASPDVCVDTDTDNANCGGCGVACASGQACDGTGHCSETCASGYSACGSGDTAYCADFANDRLHCGDCDTACNPGEVCEGSCQPLTLSSMSAPAAEAGSTLTLTGTGLSMSDVVFFGSSIATPMAATDTTLDVLVPADISGAMPIHVEREGVASNPLSFVFWADTPVTPASDPLTGCTMQFSNTGRKVAIGGDAEIYVAMMCAGQAYVSTSFDGGLSFGQPQPIPGFTSVSELAIQGGPGDTVYALANVAGTLQFAVSHAGGSFWSTQQLGSVTPWISLATSGDTVWAATGGIAVYTNTSDGDGSFTAATASPPQPPAFGDVVYTPGSNTLWAVGDTPVLQFAASSDGGASFAPVTNPDTQSGAFFSDWTASGTTIYAAGTGSNNPSNTLWIVATGTMTISGVQGLVTPTQTQGQALSADVDGNVYYVAPDASGIELQQYDATAQTLGAATPLGAGSWPAVVAGFQHSAVVAWIDGNGAVQTQVKTFP